MNKLHPNNSGEIFLTPESQPSPWPQAIVSVRLSWLWSEGCERSWIDASALYGESRLTATTPRFIKKPFDPCKRVVRHFDDNPSTVDMRVNDLDGVAFRHRRHNRVCLLLDKLVVFWPRPIDRSKDLSTIFDDIIDQIRRNTDASRAQHAYSSFPDAPAVDVAARYMFEDGRLA